MQVKELLAKLVSFDSVFGNEKSIADFLFSYVEKLGFSAAKVPLAEDRYNIIAERGGGTATLLLYGHMDTVPVYNGWETDPFTLTEKDDRLYGLGSCDMKGGMAALLVALEAIPKELPVKLLLAVDEENESAGAWKVATTQQEWLTGITHMLSVETGASAKKVGGADVLTLGRRGRVRFVVKVTGFSAHGAHIDRGVNAINMASELVQAVKDMPLPTHEQLGPASHYVAKIDAAAKGLSLPDYCELEIERSTVAPETAESCLKQYQELCDHIVSNYKLPAADAKLKMEVSLKPRQNPYMESFVTPADDQLAVKAAEAIRKHAKGLAINYGRSVGDENVFANTSQDAIHPLILGPEGANIHSPNEWVSAASLQLCSDIYKDLLLSYLK